MCRRSGFSLHDRMIVHGYRDVHGLYNGMSVHKKRKKDFRSVKEVNHGKSFPQLQQPNIRTPCQHVENSVVKLTFVQKLTFSYGARRVLLVSICNMSEDSCIFHKDFSSLQVNILMHFSRLGKTLCKMHNGILLFFSLKKIFEFQKNYLFRNTQVSFCNLQKISS